MAKLCRSVCSETRLPISATWAAAWQMRLSCRVVIGFTGFWPGNSQATGLPMRKHPPKAALYRGQR